jgi:hypothetical protein
MNFEADTMCYTCSMKISMETPSHELQVNREERLARNFTFECPLRVRNGQNCKFPDDSSSVTWIAKSICTIIKKQLLQFRNFFHSGC